MDNSKRQLFERAVNEHYAKHGDIVVSKLHDELADSNHYAHCTLEWDDSKAAIEYRFYQIRRYLKTVTIEREERRVKLYNVRVLRDDAPSKEGRYLPVADMTKDEVEIAFLLLRGYLRSAEKAFGDFEAEIEKRPDHELASVLPKLKQGMDLVSESISVN